MQGTSIRPSLAPPYARETARCTAGAPDSVIHHLHQGRQPLLPAASSGEISSFAGIISNDGEHGGEHGGEHAVQQLAITPIRWATQSDGERLQQTHDQHLIRPPPLRLKQQLRTIDPPSPSPSVDYQALISITPKPICLFVRPAKIRWPRSIQAASDGQTLTAQFGDSNLPPEPAAARPHRPPPSAISSIRSNTANLHLDPSRSQQASNHIIPRATITPPTSQSPHHAHHQQRSRGQSRGQALMFDNNSYDLQLRGQALMFDNNSYDLQLRGQALMFDNNS
ncbi:hypothetical protein ACLOJK_039598 [Asimina triloba]